MILSINLAIILIVFLDYNFAIWPEETSVKKSCESLVISPEEIKVN